MACYHPVLIYKSIGGKKHTDLRSQHPCGQCIGCKLEKSRQWAIRMMHEAQTNEISSFVTLTYNNENYPSNGSLDKRVCQLFVKRLRKSTGNKTIRYYLCGEYGEQTGRAHYHIIIFGYWPKDAKFYKSTTEGKLYTSDELDKIWGKGNTITGNVTFESSAYVARYVTKKITGEKAIEHYKGKLPEFALMSRRPGIGYTWLLKYQDEVWNSDSVVMRSREMRPPQYYLNKLKQTDHVRAALIKGSRSGQAQYIADQKSMEEIDKNHITEKTLTELKIKFFSRSEQF